MYPFLRTCSVMAGLTIGVLICVTAAQPTVQKTPDAILVDNQRIQLRLDKNSGRIDSLRLDDRELLGGDGRIYYNTVHRLASGEQRTWYESNERQISVHQQSDYVDLAIHHDANEKLPMDLTQHYVVREGETGLHIYTEMQHTEKMDPMQLVLLRTVVRADPTLFDHHSISDTRYGGMPEPEELRSSTKVQDATFRLPEDTQYEADTGKRVYTKYDWSAMVQESDVYGYYGDKYGIWLVNPSKETMPGGPDKQHNTVHQTRSTPVLLNLAHSMHYGQAGPLQLTGNWRKTSGPKYLHLNRGDNREEMRSDAKQFADVSVHRDFYDSLSISDRPDAADRGVVSGQLQFAGDGQPADATVVLADNQTNVQFSRRGYQYWSNTGPDGTFTIDGVRPGTYRLTAYKDGVFGTFHQDDVTVSRSGRVNLNDLTWDTPREHRVLWQIGTPDRTAREFKHGGNFRQFGLWQAYPTDFPDDVNFIIGESTERTDWNHVHWQKRYGEGTSPDWDIRFTPDHLPDNEGARACLTIAVAGQRRSVLDVELNGKSLASWDLQYESQTPYRSGIRGAYELERITFPISRLEEGQQNVMTLSHDSVHSVKHGILYDALRLSVDGSSVQQH